MRPQIPLHRFEIFAQGLERPEGLALDADGSLWAGRELGQVDQIDRTVATLGGFNLGPTFVRFWERAGGYRLRNPNFAVSDREANLDFSDCREFTKSNGSLFAEDRQRTILAGPTNIAFGCPNFDEMYLASLSRWQICRARAGIEGQTLSNQH
jgi:hypothetical protein